MAIFTPGQICDNYVEASIVKAKSPILRLIILGLSAGAFIALGAVGSSTAVFSLGDTGLVRFITGLVFPVGLCMVVVLGAELFTGNALMITALIRKKITLQELLRNWTIVYLANFVGAFAVAVLVAFSGQLDIGGGSLAVYTAKVAASKSSYTWGNAFVLGMFCNLLVCLAVYLGNSAQDTAGKIIGLYLPVMLFVVAGFEHSIANMYYISAGILANVHPAYTALIADAGINTAVLNFQTFISANLIPVTLGNIVGGVLVGLIFYVTHGTKNQCANQDPGQSS